MSDTRCSALFGALVLAGSVGCAGSHTPAAPAPSTVTMTVSATPGATSASSPTPSPSPAAASTACVQLGGAVATDGICHVDDAAAAYDVHVSFPADYPDEESMVACVSQQRDQFADFVSSRPRRDPPYALELTGREYRSGSAASGTVGVVFEVYRDVGGAHPETTYATLSYDLTTRAPITLDALFEPDSDPVAVLDPIVQRRMDDVWGASGGPAPTNLLGAKMYPNFAITDDAVVFFIDQGAWLPEAAGPQVVSVSRRDLAAVLAQSVR